MQRTIQKAERPTPAVDSRLIATAGIMLAFVFVMTRIAQIAIGPGGYIHLGDAAIYVAAFLFGPVVGVFAGAVGTAAADLSSPYGSWAPGSFVVHGLQALVAALIAWRRDVRQMIIAAIAGGAIVVVGYFLYQWLVLQQGIGPATAALWPNAFQVIAGAVIGIPVVLAVRRAYPPVDTFGHQTTWHEEREP